MSDNNNCEVYKLLIVQYVDKQISPEDRLKLQKHLSTCINCKEDLKQQQNWKEVSSEMKNNLMPDMAWNEYWQHLYNKLERGISWILISVGAIIFLGIGVYHFIANVLGSSEMNNLEKTGVFILAFGFVILFVSVVREKLMVHKHDKYKEIQR